MVPDEKEDLNKFADEIFGSHDKSETPGNASGESASAQQKQVARIVDKDKWTQATNRLNEEYRQLARQPYEESEYPNREDKTVRTRYRPRQKYALRFELWDGTSRHIALHHRTNELQ